MHSLNTFISNISYWVSTINRTQPSGLLKVALLTHNNKWKWRVEEKTFVARTIQGNSYGMAFYRWLSNCKTHFYARLGDTLENLKRVAAIIENYYYFGVLPLGPSHIQLNTDVHNPPPDLSPSAPQQPIPQSPRRRLL